MKSPAHLDELIDKFLNGTATPEEMAELNAWYHSYDDTQAEILTDEPLTGEELGQAIHARLPVSRPVIVPFRKRIRTWAAAAILILALITAAYFIWRPEQPAADPVKAVLPAVQDIAPGGNRATLTLGDGSVVILDSTASGWSQLQGNSQVEKLGEGSLAYRPGTAAGEAPVMYNTITTPRGGQYQVTLSDGTKVWLNAASSIRFPVIFSGPERRVEVTGETYFEVAKNPVRPFRVRAGQTEVEVLGTHFNLNAYDDESAIRTTLLEGKVKVSVPESGQSPRFLSPGQQSGIQPGGRVTISDRVDTEEAVAWIHGRFQFKSTDLRTILRQIARWYDVDIEYRGAVDLHFTGQLTRNQHVSKVLETLALTGEVKFSIQNRKIIVTR